MYDPRWDDAREREDERGRGYDQPDREHGPRDGLLQDLDLPRGDTREFVVDRDRTYELNGEDVEKRLREKSERRRAGK